MVTKQVKKLTIVARVGKVWVMDVEKMNVYRNGKDF